MFPIRLNSVPFQVCRVWNTGYYYYYCIVETEKEWYFCPNYAGSPKTCLNYAGVTVYICSRPVCNTAKAIDTTGLKH